MKQLKGWDAYVAEATSGQDQHIELPLTEDEVYVLDYPTRAQARKIQAAYTDGDTDALIVALLGEEAGRRVVELSENYPASVLDLLLLDVLRKFGLAPDDDTEDQSAEQPAEQPVEQTTNGAVTQTANGKKSGGKSASARPRNSATRSGTSSRSSGK